ncbi:uncharacterized protein TRAVEDRAFT_50875 [Trametes versicolor FP-101664 SS1]|uniref:uncharacterized protein n=1 Tax=Trametes versicolor (strain FP-101664) TaxID=717944 RepID=UPI0004624941|nr:uncharacterized protein TRAVEDRAFT_50875 [Trametes versicolor FP-101664 SS1]EIW54734.1 hypothetical protein TRAVEDRAFT_50875 [Trametes versicolor FP-101664 SS1]
MPPPTKLPAHEPESPPEALETIPRLSPTKALDMYHPPAAHEPTEPMPMKEPAAAIPTEAFSEVLSSSMDALQGASDACSGSAPTPFVYATFALMILNILLVGAVAYAMYRQSKSARRTVGRVPSPEPCGAARGSCECKGAAHQPAQDSEAVGLLEQRNPAV